MAETDLLQQALKKIKDIKYSSETLAQQSQERIAIYNEYGINPITSLALEITCLWEFIDKGLGPAVGYAGLLDELLKKEEKQQKE